MGIFLSDSASDAHLITRVCNDLAHAWNDTYSETLGKYVLVGSNEIEGLCTLGATILRESFPEHPSAYKRLAILAVLSCLHPFFSIRKRDESGEFIRISCPDEERAKFVAQLTLALIQGISASLRQTTSGGSEYVVIKNYPSEHFLQELLVFMTWIPQSGCLAQNRTTPDFKYDGKRLARIILAFALIFEAVSKGQNQCFTLAKH